MYLINSHIMRRGDTSSSSARPRFIGDAVRIDCGVVDAFGFGPWVVGSFRLATQVGSHCLIREDLSR